MKNRVFRCIEGRARGFVGFLMGELVAGFGVFGIGVFAGHPLVGIGTGALVLFGAATCRRRDCDRSDYMLVALRRAKGGHMRAARVSKEFGQGA